MIGCAGQREQQTRALYTLAQRLAGAVTVEQSMLEVQQFVRGNQYVGLRVLLPTPEEILKVPGGSRSSLSATEAMFAKTVFSSGDAIALFDESPATLVLPLCGVTRPRGVMLVSGESLVLQTQRALMEAVASLLATALDRLHFVEVAQENRMQMLTERLRGSILAALSHDVRTPPLTVLYGLADTLTLPQQNLSEQALQTACSIRLSGVQGHSIKVELADNLTLIEFDAVLLERVFCHLIENAAKYSPPDSAISIRVTSEGHDAVITVSNAGTGFIRDKLIQVFEHFARDNAECNFGGVGMGLAICRAVIEAHGGQIAAINPETGGACVRFTLPLGEPPMIEPELGELA